MQVKPIRKEVVIQNMVLLSESTQIIYFWHKHITTIW
jgi:hypothetical protein